MNNEVHKRIYGLDILRAGAIIFVMLSHGVGFSDRILDVTYYKWLLLDGVSLFFVLSGFLIGAILIKTAAEKKFTFTGLLHFWIRRWFRTLPGYYLVLIILVACYVVVHHHVPPQMLRYFTFTQCFASPHPLFFGEAWSLAVEEWFYILVPGGLYLLLFFTKGNQRYILGWIIAVLIAGTLIRILKVSQNNYFIDGDFGLEIGKQVITRMDGIMYGMLGAWLSIYRSVPWLKHKRMFFCAGILLLFIPKILFNDSLFFVGYVSYTVASVGALCILPLLSAISTGKGTTFKAVTFISTISYAMYLTNHMVVSRAIMPRLLHWMNVDAAQSITNSAIALCMFWVLTLCISYALYRFWELPIMNLRDRWKPQQTASDPSTTGQ